MATKAACQKFEAVSTKYSTSIAIYKRISNDIHVRTVVSNIHNHSPVLWHGSIRLIDHWLHDQADEVWKIADKKDDSNGNKDAIHAGGDACQTVGTVIRLNTRPH